MKSSEWIATTGTALPEVVQILNPNPPKYTAGSLANAAIDTWAAPAVVEISQETGAVYVKVAEIVVAIFEPVIPPAGGGSLPFE